jgi:hypothetical protein
MRLNRTRLSNIRRKPALSTMTVQFFLKLNDHIVDRTTTYIDGLNLNKRFHEIIWVTRSVCRFFWGIEFADC